MDISVIIPIYNVEEYLLECLQSVAAQSKTVGVECLLVDDCGTDASMYVAERFVSAYKGNISFRILHHNKNCGLSAARNTGIRVAKGKFLLFLDSDDFIFPTCLENMYNFGLLYDADMVQGSYMSDSPYMKLFEKVTLPDFTSDKSLIKRILLNYDINPVMAQNRLVKKQLILDNNLFFKEGIIHEDQYWNFFLAKVINRIVFCKEKTYFYRQTPGSITNHVNEKKEIIAYNTLIKDFTANVDTFEKGAQKRIIFCLILNAINSNFYKNTDEQKNIIESFVKKNRGIVQCMLVLLFRLKKGFLRAKLINLLMNIYVRE